MEETPKYGATLLVARAGSFDFLADMLAAYQAEANGLLAAAGYPELKAQVSASLLPSGPNYQVSAPNPACVFYSNLSFGMGSTPEAALNEFNVRLTPRAASQDNPDDADRAADADVAYMKEAA